MLVRLVSEAEIADALKDLGYSATARLDGLTYYSHSHVPHQPIVLDHSKGPIPFEILLASLEIQGINVDAFVVYLED